MNTKPLPGRKYQQQFLLGDKSTVGQDTHPQSYLHPAIPEYISLKLTLLPTQFVLWEVLRKPNRDGCCKILRDFMYTNNTGTTSTTHSYAFTALEKHQCPTGRRAKGKNAGVTLYVATGLTSSQSLHTWA